LDSGPVRLGETLGDDVDSTRLGTGDRKHGTGGHTTGDQDAGSWALALGD
jgi:hypothetical protein